MTANFKIDSIICWDQQEEGFYANGLPQRDEIIFRLDDFRGPKSNYVVSNILEGLAADPLDPFHEVHPSEQLTFTEGVEIRIWEYDASGADELLLESVFIGEVARSGYLDYYNPKYDSWYTVEYTVW